MFGVEQEPKIRGSQPLALAEFEALKDCKRALASGLEVGFGRFDFDFDKLAKTVNRIEGDGIALESISCAFFADGCGGLKAEVFEYRANLLALWDRCLDLLSGFGRLVDAWPFVRHFGLLGIGFDG